VPEFYGELIEGGIGH